LRIYRAKPSASDDPNCFRSVELGFLPLLSQLV
jgi:hypothetical protein